MIEVHVDFETRSDIDIATRGLDPYFESPRFAPLIMCWSVADGPVKEWTYGQECPDEIRDAAGNPEFVFHAHNFNFERRCFDHLAHRAGWPAVSLGRARCSMAAACALGLPPGLDKLGDALNLDTQKDKRGKALIDFFSKPRKDGAFNEPSDHPAAFREFIDYCKRDVETERAAAARMIPLSDAEQRVWEMDQIINARGVRIDSRSIVTAIALIGKAKGALDAEMRETTGGAVKSVSDVAGLTAWLIARGVPVEGVDKNDVLDALDLVDLPGEVRRALEIRQEGAKSSTAKLASMLRRAGADGRCRDGFRYHGTGPGRWTSMGINLANLPRPRKEYDDADLDVGVLFKNFRAEDPGMLAVEYGAVLGRPLHLVSDAIRGFLWAAPVHDFIAVDYSGIQGCICAWLADEHGKLAAMRAINENPSLPDLYRISAAAILNTTTDVVTKKHWGRQLGKVSELALGFAGGVAAYVSMAKNYSLKVQVFHDLYPAIRAAASPEIVEKAEKRHARALKSRRKEHADAMSREAWLAILMVVLGWRAANPAIVAAWDVLENTVRSAIREPGKTFRALDRIDYLVAHGMLLCRLPSGRTIVYHAPRLKAQVWCSLRLDDGTWTESEAVEREEAEKLAAIGKARIEGTTSPAISVLGYDTNKRKMVRESLYSGKITENLCMAVEADILRRGMKNCERENYTVIMHNYDECVAEVPRGFGSVEAMEALMLEQDDWTVGLPLAAHGYRSKRYRKG